MPTPATSIGPLAIPAPVGATDARFSEPTTERLIDYVSHWLTWGLDDKLATMTRPPSPNGAVPVANRYTNAPSSVYLQRKLPALFVYWTGASKMIEYSSVKQLRQRDFAVLYVFERVVNPDNVANWSGLVSTVDALLCKAFYRLSHPTYRYDATTDLDLDIRWMNGWHDAEYMGGSEGFLKQLPTASARDLSTAAGKASTERAQGGIQEGFPSFNGIVRIWELVGLDTMLDPGDVTQDILAKHTVGEGVADGVPDFLETVLQAPPDGSASVMSGQD